MLYASARSGPAAALAPHAFLSTVLTPFLDHADCCTRSIYSNCDDKIIVICAFCRAASILYSTVESDSIIRASKR